ncbi:unnamed protein product [Clonostachys chloroleuca]|uniref:Autophagy-related protein 1 n=1 Tax=Clonostachys chloroleuca TaxID=1926264 RepID=A0AA35QF60_9HYPO|nr:unnamed protein product [Clonostachys chloroleuca]
MAALDQLEKLPESVRDSKLRAAFRYDGHQQYIVHPRGLRGRLEQKEDVWIRIKTIGAGGNGSVDLQCRKSPRTGLPTQLRAVKNIRIPEAELLSNRDFYVRELEAIAKFSSLRVTWSLINAYGDLFVKSLGWFTSEDTIHIAMEYCKLGDLQMFLFDKCPDHRLPEYQTREIASQVLEAISCMHEEYFAHRDIKPANILIQSHPPESPWAVKLADFGISRRSLGHEMNSTTTRRGTPVFWPPELHGFVTSDAEGYGNLYAADMWCFGETLFRVLTGQATFGNVAKLSKFAFGQIDFPEAILKDLSVSEGGVAFLRSLIVCNPRDRLTALDALEHPWFDQDIPNSYWEQPSTPLAENANVTDLPYRHQETTGASAVWPTRSSLEDGRATNSRRLGNNGPYDSFGFVAYGAL